MRIVVWILGFIFMFYLAELVLSGTPSVPIIGWSSYPHNEFEMVAQDDSPDFPTPVIVTDKTGRAKWTVSIPPSYDFPLTMGQYADICAKCREVSSRAQALHSNSRGLPQTILGLGSSPSELQDRHFIDVREAEKDGLLGGWAVKLSRIGKLGVDGNIVGESKASLMEKPVCQKSMTFVLESADAGLGKSMMMLWTAYGMAQNEGRAFFVDDSRWAYGDYTAIFQPPPVPPCRPPPRNEMIPCPRQARHLVVSTTTASEIFDASLGDLTLSETSPETSEQRTQYHLARQGYEALFKLNPEDGEYVESRVRELTTKRAVLKSEGEQNGMAVGIHVRRGDRHPLEYQYRHSYIPTNTYAETARQAIEDKLNHTGPHGGEDKAAKSHSFVVLTSDDPTVYEADEFRSSSATGVPVVRAQERIRLASKAAIQRATGDKHVMRKFVDETFGWEGGFFAPMFRNLGLSSIGSANANEKQQAGMGEEAAPGAETMRLRSLVGRAYVMDLAVLADVSDVVICTVSATGCRLLAVMMGWESAMEGGNWVNIDGRYRWRGVEI